MQYFALQPFSYFFYIFHDRSINRCLITVVVYEVATNLHFCGFSSGTINSKCVWDDTACHNSLRIWHNEIHEL